MAVASRVLRMLSEQSDDIALTIKFESDVRIFNDVEILDSLHWSDSVQRYCDYGHHSNNVSLKDIQRIEKHNIVEEKTREVFSKPEPRLVEDANGYISLFPFILKLLPVTSPKLLVILTNLRREKVIIFTTIFKVSF